MKKYKLQLLTSIDKEGNLKGPMGPTLMARGVAERMDMRLHGIVRIWQDDVDYLDKHIHNFPGEREAHIDCLVAMQIYKNNYTALVFMDEGDKAIPVALMHKDEIVDTGDGTKIHKVYLKRKYSLHITESELEHINTQIWETMHPKLLVLIEKALELQKQQHE